MAMLFKQGSLALEHLIIAACGAGTVEIVYGQNLHCRKLRISLV